MNLEEGYGCHYVSEGREYLDFTSGGIFQAILGNDFTQRVIRQVTLVREIPKITSCYGHTNPWTERYKDQLKEFTGFESVALFTTGSEATEAFWRCMRVYTGKTPIWGGLVDPDEVGDDNPAPDAMHGVTGFALIMAGKLTDVYGFRFGQAPESTCGQIMEPYHGPSGQFHRIHPTIERIIAGQAEFPEIPLCIDEIQGGFGRTGRLFAHQWYDPAVSQLDGKWHYGLKPDFVTIGKAMGAGFPISALLGQKEIMESKAVIEHGHLHSTHSGHPMMCAIGSAVIEEIQKHDLIERSRTMGADLERLLMIEIEPLGVRYHAGRGLLAGLEFKDTEEAEAVQLACERRGLMVVSTGRKWLKLGPALIITDEQLEDGVRILREAIEEVISERPMTDKELALSRDSEICRNPISKEAQKKVVKRYDEAIEEVLDG